MANAIDEVVGARIRALRMSHGLSQSGLADLVGITFQQIQKYETGVNRVSASRLWDIARAMRVPVSYFFEGIEAAAEAGSRRVRDGKPHLADDEALAFARSFVRLPRVQRQAMMVLVESLSEATVAKRGVEEDG